MKKMIILLTMFCLFLSLSTAFADKAGKVYDDTLYVDNNFDFCVKVADGWKVKKVGGDDDIRRLIILKRNAVLPMHYGNDRSYFTEPMLTLLADSTEISVDSLLVLIQKMDSNHIKIVEEALGKFSLPSRTNFNPKFGRKRSIKIGKFKGIKIEIQKPYTINIDDQMNAAPRRVSDFTRGLLYILKKEKTTIIAECVSEKERFGFNEENFESMIGSLDDMNKAEKEKKAEEEMNSKVKTVKKVKTESKGD